MMSGGRSFPTPPGPEDAVRPDPFRLFVYGTLMRGGRYHGDLDGQRLLGPARTLPRYALLDLGAYPGLVDRPEDGRVVAGEVYEVAAALLPRLDAIEGSPELFRLGLVALEGVEGLVYTYFYQRGAAGVPLYAGERWENRRPRS
jgi:gamma-glutamylaminecyclotransferase